jgi:hypothetical protein
MCFGSLRCGAPRAVEEIALWRLSMLRRPGPSPWFFLAGWPGLGTCLPVSNPQSSWILSIALSTATFVSDVTSTCRLPWLTRTPPRRLSTSCWCRADPQLRGSRTAVGTAPAPTPPSVTGPGASSWRSWEPRGVCTLAPPPRLCAMCVYFRLGCGAPTRYSLTPHILDISGK